MDPASEPTVAPRPTKAFFPLRSNCAWFGTPADRIQLESRLKASLVIYDRLLLEDGTFRLVAGQDNQGMEFFIPPGASDADRKKVSYSDEGSRFAIQADGKTIMSSTSHRAYNADFYPIVYDADLLNAGFIEWFRGELSAEIKQGLNQKAVLDQLRRDCESALPENRYLQSAIVKGLVRDSTLAYFLNLPIAVDQAAAKVIRRQQELTQDKWQSEIPPHFLEYWIDLELPNFAQWSWEDIVVLRDSQVGVAFREMVKRICSRTRDVLAATSDSADIRDAISREFARELIEELKSRRVTVGGTIASLALNLVPFGFIPSIAKDCYSLGQEQESWISLLFAQPNITR